MVGKKEEEGNRRKIVKLTINKMEKLNISKIETLNIRMLGVS